MRAKEDIEKQLQEQKLALEEQKKRYEEMEVCRCFSHTKGLAWVYYIYAYYYFLYHNFFYILPLINYCFQIHVCILYQDKLFWNSNNIITKDEFPVCDGVWVTYMYPQPLWLALHATIPVVSVFTGIVSNRVLW